ncbi:hypothetical protein QEN19_001461 [Hanseniaspora menglaensis]
MRTRSKSITLAENFDPSNPDNKALDLPKIRASLVDASTSGTIKRSHSINTASTTTTKRKSIFSSLFGGSTNKSTSPSKKLAVDTKSNFTTHSFSGTKHSPEIHNAPVTPSEDSRSICSVSSSDNSIIHTPSVNKELQLHHVSSRTVVKEPVSYEDKLKAVGTKRVAFKVQTFTIDPPQQIPGRNPRKGVKLLPYELATTINIDEGIASGSTEKPVSQASQQATDISETKEYRLLLEHHTTQLKESMAHQQSSYFRAKKLEQELHKLDAAPSVSSNPINHLLGSGPSRSSSFSKSHVSALAETINKVLPVPHQQALWLAKQSNFDQLTDPLEKRPPGLIRQASEENIIIDMPIHRHHSFVDELPTHTHLNASISGEDVEDQQGSVHSDSSPSSPSSLTIVDKNLSLDKVYTRCCHLREILPIPITLKQLKNKKNPLQILKFLNPKPTLVDILSFTDFIQCIDLKMLVFDNVILSNRMVTIIFKSVAKLMLKNQLEKLSLRNVTINKENWSLLCKIISLAGNSLQSIDVSQTKLRKELQDDKSYLRAQMDWDMFWYVIEQRKERILRAKKPEALYHEFNLIYFNSVTPGAKYSLLPPPPEEKEKEKEKMRELKRLLKEQQLKDKDTTS